jgi:hypothetical protein
MLKGEKFEILAEKKTIVFINFSNFLRYRKVASSRLLWVVGHFRIFRQFIKGKFDANLLRLLAKFKIE